VKTLVFALFLALSVGSTVGFAQNNAVLGDKTEEQERYSARCDFTLAGTDATCAIAVSTSVDKRTFLENVVINSPTTTTATFGWGGTAPTGTALASTKYVKRNTTSAPVAVVYEAATSAGAAAQSLPFPVTANTPAGYSVAGHRWASGAGNTRTLVVTITGVSGTGWVDFHWGQKK
jgi:hypothetical protein